MNLVDQFSSLAPPDTANASLFNTATLVEYPFAKIGINNQQFPILLIAASSLHENLTLRNIRLKHLELAYNMECRISEDDKSSYSTFTVIVFKTEDENLIRYFLQIAETFIKLLSSRPTIQEVATVFKNFIEIFRALAGPPTKTLNGLWAELFLINFSRSPEVLLNYWHNIPAERFDFNADIEKIEVKSSSTMERVHTFASEQLNPEIDKQVLIASIFIKQSSSGQSVVDVANEIKRKVENDQLREKLYSIISLTLGSALDECIKVKFDSDLAKNSIRFYKHQEIDKIERVHIPNRVVDVRFKSDLSICQSIEPTNIANKGALFSAL